MKLFLTEHVPFTIFYFVQLFLTCLICWLDGFTHLFTLLYACLLSTALYIGYLVYRYVSHRDFYMRLSAPSLQPEGLMSSSQRSPLTKALRESLSSQFEQFHNKLYASEHQLNKQITFINQWVHHMKTPLSVIYLTIQDQDDPIFTSIQDEVDRIQKGLETILYTSRLSVFSHDFQAESISLAQFVKDVCSSHKRLFIRNRVYPSIEIDDQAVVASDEKWLAFVLTQLLTNAVRYSANISQTIAISSYKRGKQLVLEIKDFGIGIPPQDQKRVFNAYFTGENGRKYQESTGMGLYLVKEICKQLNHHVELDSKQDMGTSVRLVFQQNLADSPLIKRPL